MYKIPSGSRQPLTGFTTTCLLMQSGRGVIPFLDLLYHVRDHYSVIRAHFEFLKQFAKLRNAIVHQKTQVGYYIVKPHSDVIDQIEHICTRIEHPPAVITIVTHPVNTFDVIDPLMVVLSIISATGYS